MASKVQAREDGRYYSKIVINGVTKIDLTADTVDAAHLLEGFTAHGKNGAPITGTCTFDADTGDATATAAEILTGKTAYVTGSKVTGSMANNGGVKGTISNLTTPYTIPQGYHDGSGTVSIDEAEKSKIVADNIRQGVTILGVEGTMTGTENVKVQSKTVTPSFSPQTITPDSPDYNYLSQVTVNAIPVQETLNEQGGYTITVG